MSVSFHSEQLNFRLLKIKLHRQWIEMIISNHSRKTGNINFIFTSNKYILELNREYLNHSYFTDVITFDYSDGDEISGDIYISKEQVKINSLDYGLRLEDELRRVMVHGVLHLMGFSDSAPEEKIEMRSEEDKSLKIWRV